MAYVNIFTSDRGWILEQLATEITKRLSYVRFEGIIDPAADVQYYMTYSTWQSRVSPVEVGYFAHQEQDAATAQRFLDVASQIDHCVCHSQIYEQRLRDAGITTVTTIPPGVDLGAFQPAVKIGVVGRTYHTGRKGEALVQAVMNLPNIEWHFSGEGWPGPARKVPPGQMPAFYNEMDYILVPALYEGGPMSVAEALACGTPVIAPPIGWVPDFPHIEFRTGDVNDLRRVLTEVVNERLLLRAAALPYTWDRWAEGHDQLFRSLVQQKGLPPLAPPASAHRARRAVVTLALHGSEKTSLGGPSVRVPQMASRMQALGHDAQAVFFPDPAVMSSELVHAFNVWSPETALGAVRQVRALEKRLVLSPIFIDLRERHFWEAEFLAGLATAQSAEEVGAAAHLLLKRHRQHRRPGSTPVEPDLGYHATVRELVSLADHIVFLSEHERNAMAAIGAMPEAATVIRNPVDTEWAQRADPHLFRTEMGLGDFVLCLARLEPRKNQLLLLEALRDTDIPIVLIGAETNPQYSSLLDLYSSSRVRRIGRLEPRSPLLASALAAARVVALPSWAEGAPLAALEAAAFGANLVLSNRSAEREYFGPLARYCDPADVSSIRSAIVDAWDSPPTEAARSKLREHVVAHNNWGQHVRSTLEVYAKVLDRPASPLEHINSVTPMIAPAAQFGIEAPKSALTLLMDVTTLSNHQGRLTGIARTELAIARELVRSSDCSVMFVAFCGPNLGFVEIDPAAIQKNQVGAFRAFAERYGRRLELPVKLPLLVVGSAWLQSVHYPQALKRLVNEQNLLLYVFVHDVIPMRHPHWYAEGYTPRFRDNLREVLSTCAGIFCNSKNTARDIREAALELGVTIPAPGVVRLGDDLEGSAGVLRIRPDVAALAEAPGYVLAVGAVHSRKNYSFLGEVWAALREQLRGRCPRLVIVGGTAWNGADTVRALLEDARLRGSVVLLEDIDDSTLAWLYDHSLLTVYPSLYEGWGLPVAESLARGKICIASNRASIPEIAPGLTDLLDPLDFVGWLDRLRRYLTSSVGREPRETVIREGYEPCSWAEAAATMMSHLRSPPTYPSRRTYGYLPGRPLRVNDNTSPSVARLQGWHAPESWGAWSSHRTARIRLTLAVPATGERAVMFRARVEALGLRRWCDVTVNGHTAGRVFFGDNRLGTFLLRVPAPAIRGLSRVEVDFTPSHRDYLMDGREVGIALTEVALLDEAEASELFFRTPSSSPVPVRPLEYLDLTTALPSIIEGMSTLRAGWGRSGVAGAPLTIALRCFPPPAQTARLRVRCRAAATPTNPQAIFFQYPTGEILDRILVDDDEVQTIDVPLNVQGIGPSWPLMVQIAAPLPNKLGPLGLGEDDEPFGVGVFDLALVDEDAAVHVDLRSTSEERRTLHFGALLPEDAIFAAPYLLSSSWHDPDLDGRWTNGADGVITLPAEWLSPGARFWVEVSARGNNCGAALAVEAWSGARLAGKTMVRGEGRGWLEVALTGESSMFGDQTFHLRTSRTARVVLQGVECRVGIFVSRIVFKSSEVNHADTSQACSTATMLD